MNKLSMVLIVCVAGTMSPLLAFADGPPPPDGEHHGPRPEAIAACKDKKEGDACTFEGRHGTVTSTCQKAQTGDLACHHKHHEHIAPSSSPAR